MIRAGFAAAVLCAAGISRLGAQVVDTARVDSLARDTTDYTALFLKAQEDAKRLIPVAPRVGSSLLLPVRTRFVLDADSVLWHGAETVADLLTRVPGVYLLRGGWAGRPELPAYQAHGASSVTYLFDGIPYVPLGPDSLMVDPSLLPLSFIDRVEIERLPGQLRVWLFTHRNNRDAPFSRIGIASGDLQISRYQGILEKRSAKGPGFAVAFDHFAVPAQPTQTGSYSNTQGWLRFDYVRSAKAGAEAQIFLNSPEREPIVLTSGDTVSRVRHFKRRDYSIRGFFAPGQNGLGPRLDLVLSRSTWKDAHEDSTLVLTDVTDSLGVVTGQDTSYTISNPHGGVTQLGALAAYRLPAASVDAALWWRSNWTPLELRAGAALSPLPWLTLRLDGTYLRHQEERTSRWLTARAGLTLPWGFSGSATMRLGNEVMHPFLSADTAQRISDRSFHLVWQSRYAELEGSFITNAEFHPEGYQQYPNVVKLQPTPRTDWFTVSGRVIPRQWLSLGGWFSTPRIARPQGQPANHMLLHATIQSKFLPTFKSGIFNLKLSVSLEHWNAGVLGQDSTGTPATLEAATLFRGFLGIQIGRFTAYYDRYNMQGALKGYVPGLLVPGYASTFGVRWEFSN